MVSDAMCDSSWLFAIIGPYKAAELLDWQKHPDIAIEIQDRLTALREAWDVNRDKHLAMLVKIRDASMEKGCMEWLTKQRSCGAK